MTSNIELTLSFLSSSTDFISLSSFLPFPFLFARTAHAAVDSSNIDLKLFVRTCISTTKRRRSFLASTPQTFSPRPQYFLLLASYLHRHNAFYALSQSSSPHPLFIQVPTIGRCALVCFSWRLVDALTRFLIDLAWPLACDEQWTIRMAMKMIPAIGSFDWNCASCDKGQLNKCYTLLSKFPFAALSMHSIMAWGWAVDRSSDISYVDRLELIGPLQSSSTRMSFKLWWFSTLREHWLRISVCNENLRE